MQANENLDKKIQELKTRLTDTNDDLKKTEENLEKAQNIIKQCKEENINLEDKLSKCRKENVLQADSRQKDVMITFSNIVYICLYIIFQYYFVHTHISLLLTY